MYIVNKSKDRIGKYQDRSTKDGFHFTFCCTLCEEAYESGFVDYPIDGSNSNWEKAREVAFQAALRQAKRRFNRCVSCESWVCDRHFDAETRLCTKCASKK